MAFGQQMALDVASRYARGPVLLKPCPRAVYRGRVGRRKPPCLPRAAKFTAFDDFFTKVPTAREEIKVTEQSSVFVPPADWKRPDVELTTSDEQFLERGIEFVEGPDGIDLEALNELFVKVRFPRREPRRLRVALENTYLVLWIRYAKPSTRFAKKGQILGFARVISDGAFFASIWDVAVLPAWQRSGLGRGLMERLIQKLMEADIPTITLYAERDVVALYEKLGFKVDLLGSKGMAFAIKS